MIRLMSVLVPSLKRQAEQLQPRAKVIGIEPGHFRPEGVGQGQISETGGSGGQNFDQPAAITGSECPGLLGQLAQYLGKVGSSFGEQEPHSRQLQVGRVAKDLLGLVEQTLRLIKLALQS